MQIVSGRGWAPWCAGLLLALLAFTLLHAAAPHHGTQRDCATCKALQSPGVADIAVARFSPAPPADRPERIPASRPLLRSRALQPLRAPPAAA